MSEEDIVGRTFALAREEAADDGAWEAVARGDASPEVRAELERRAAADAEVAAILEASAPLGDDAAERIAARIERDRPEEAEVVPLAAVKARAAQARSGATIARRAAVLVAPLALAAALVLYVTAGPGGGAALPEYTVAAAGEQAMRGPSEAAAVLRLGASPDARFEIVARPATAAADPVVAYAFAMGEGEPSPVEARIDVAQGGAVRVAGAARALAGAREVRLVVGAPDAIGRFDGALARATSGDGDARVRVLRIAIVRE